jgi:DNA-binding protein H-NS
MATVYEQIKAQIVELERKAVEARKQEIKDAVATVRDLVQKHGLSLADIGAKLFGKPTSAASAKPAAAKSPAKYRDPKSGSTWTGRGKPPKWIVGVASRDAFLIDKVEAPKAPKAAPQSAAKAAPKKIAARKAKAPPASA